MRIAFYTNIVSPHQLPFARELVKRVGAENYRYIYSEPFHAERSAMGWQAEQEPWILSETEQREESQRWLEEADVLIIGHRDLGLIERRCQKGLRTFYASERWFKPVPIPFFTSTFHLHLYLPGWVRMFVPSYFKMVRRFVALTRKYDTFRLLPYGVWAERDFRRMGVPADRVTAWGYAVAPTRREVGVECERRVDGGSVVRVLWVGRMLKLKNVDTIIRAVVCANQMCQDNSRVKKKGEGEQRRFVLSLVGDGPEKPRLRQLVEKIEKKMKHSAVHLQSSPSPIVTFRPPCPVDEVRTIMREHDVYVFASNGLDGWGAVVSEALEEGMLCLGSREAGASATLLPVACQFGPRDAVGLAQRLLAAADGKLPHVEIEGWSAKGLAERFMRLC